MLRGSPAVHAVVLAICLGPGARSASPSQPPASGVHDGWSRRVALQVCLSGGEAGPQFRARGTRRQLAEGTAGINPSWAVGVRGPCFTPARAPQGHQHDAGEQEQKPAEAPAGASHEGAHETHGGEDTSGAHGQRGAQQKRPVIPPLTDADRAAAFPDVRGHAVHDQAINYFVLVDELELGAGGGRAARWASTGWIGRDLQRVWFRTEGAADRGRLDEAEVHLLYGRAIAPWWDLVAGLRQDVRPGPMRSWLAVGLQGLAPYWFDVEATAYIGAGGRTLLRLETDYELLLTNRWIAQPGISAEIAGTSDRERGIGAGLSSMEAGVRVRYEIRRELAPYAGVTWSRSFFGTRELADGAGERSDGVGLAVGLRLWF